MEQQCRDCGTPFKISDSEQAFYQSKGFDLPRRCAPCRKKRKAERENGGNY